MKYLKHLGLTAVAATALMAFGASSASADVLCKVEVNAAGECPTTNDYPANTVFTTRSTNPTFTVTGSSVGVSTVNCTESNMILENTSTGSNTPGAAVTGKVTRLQFGGTCRTNNGFTCTISETAGYTTTAKTINNSGAGSLVTSGSGIRTLDNCAAGLFKCEYEMPAGGLTFQVNQGNPAKLVATEQNLVTVPGGSGCGTQTKFDATYTLNGTNTSLWLATKNA